MKKVYSSDENALIALLLRQPRPFGLHEGSQLKFAERLKGSAA